MFPIAGGGQRTTITLPLRHTRDWYERLGEARGVNILRESARTVTLSLTPEDLEDLRADADDYAHSGEYERGYRDAASRVLVALAP